MIATAKRQGKTVATNGNVTGSVDSTKPYYRSRNTLDKTYLPTIYTNNAVTTQTHSTGLIQGRPWK